MTGFYENLIEKSGFEEALISHVLDFSKNVNIDEFSRLFFDAEPCRIESTGVLCFDEAFYPYEFYSSASALFSKMKMPAEKGFLYLYVTLMERAFDEYKHRGLCESIFFDTMKTLAFSAKKYFKEKGFYGIYDYRFAANHVRGSVIRLGVFEYQYGLRDEKRVIVLHVPDGADMDKEKRHLSYDTARQYYGNYPIVAESWLLYEEHRNMLPPDSSIVSFMDDFDVILQSKSVDYSELFHVFGHLEDYSYEKLPKATLLQQAYAQRIKHQLEVGSGTGIITAVPK